MAEKLPVSVEVRRRVGRRGFDGQVVKPIRGPIRTRRTIRGAAFAALYDGQVLQEWAASEWPNA